MNTKHLKRCAYLLALVGSSLAHATVYPWHGVYGGAQLGEVWNQSHFSFTNPNYFNTSGATRLGNNFRFKANSFIGGADLGYQYQRGAMVLGLEGSYSGMNTNKRIRSPFFPATDTYRADLQTIATATLKMGYAFKEWLGYLNGGYAGGKLKINFNDNAANVNAGTSQWINGWALGLGADYRLTRVMTFGVIYDYARLNLNKKTISCPNCGTGPGFGAPSVDGHINNQAVMARLNYLINV